MAFDSNAMLELAHVSRDRYQRAGGGGAHKVYATTKAYYDARGFKELSPFEQTCIEILVRFRSAADLAKQEYRLDCLLTKEGFYYEGEIPF
jgi:hypothetical protein